MSIKDGFNLNGSETYQSREEWLQMRADQLDQMLNTPEPPGMHLRPEGQLRQMGDEYARQQIETRKLDIEQELDRIRDERGPQPEQTNTQSKTR